MSITVENLIAQLQECPPGAVVMLEGRESIGHASGSVWAVDHDGVPLHDRFDRNAAKILLKRED